MNHIKNKVQLITYPDSLGGDLRALNEILQKYLKDIFTGGIHILPPFRASGDRGFAPISYFEIDPVFGTWEDIKKISKDFDVMLDLMVNHISRQSKYFQDFLKNGRKSKYAALFLTIDKIWGNTNPTKEDISKIFLRRPNPFSTFTIGKTGIQETVWTTFGKSDPSEQIDLNIESNKTKKLFKAILNKYHKNHVKFVRLDAVGYIIKKAGTSCFFVEPEITKFLDWITNITKRKHIVILPEIHAHYSIQFKLAKCGYWIYDFVLPFMILETLINKSSQRIYRYLKDRPPNQITMLDCHDGIPINPDLNDFYEQEETTKIIDICLNRGANLSYIFSAGQKSKKNIVHQIRGTYYSLLDCNDDAYIAARAIQFFTPGIPQVYYTGLLAGTNDYEKADAKGDGREINRHNYDMKEFQYAVEQKVVQRLLTLIRFRNDYPAFNGNFLVLDSNPDELKLSWQKEDKKCTLNLDLSTYKSVVEYVDIKGKKIEFVL